MRETFSQQDFIRNLKNRLKCICKDKIPKITKANLEVKKERGERRKGDSTNQMISYKTMETKSTKANRSTEQNIQHETEVRDRDREKEEEIWHIIEVESQIYGGK